VTCLDLAHQQRTASLLVANQPLRLALVCSRLLPRLIVADLLN
jgi:hypothetical protein